MDLIDKKTTSSNQIREQQQRIQQLEKQLEKSKEELLYERRLRREQQLKHDRMLNHLPVYTYIFDLVHFKNEFANSRIVEVLGYNRQEILAIGESIMETIFDRDDHDCLLQHWQDLIVAKEGEIKVIEYGVINKDGSKRMLKSFDTPFEFDEAGNATKILGVCQDITHLNDIYKQKDELATRLNLALEGASLGIWDWDLTNNDVVFDRRWCEMVGLSDHEIDMNLRIWEERVHPDDLQSCYDDIKAYMDGKTDYYENIHRMKHRDGHWVYILDRGRFSGWDDDGKPIRFTGTHFDITAYKMAELELQDTKDFLEIALETAEIGTWSWQPDSGFSTWDEKMHEIMGVAPGTEGNRFEMLLNAIIPTETMNIKEEIDNYRQAGGKREYRIKIRRYNDASIKTLLLKSYMKLDKHGIPINTIGACLDITTLDEAQSKLKETSEFLGLALETAEVGTWIWDLQTDEVIWDDKMHSIMGLDPSSDVNKFDYFLDRLIPEHRERSLEVIANYSEGIYDEGVNQYKIIWKSDGSEHHISTKNVLFRDKDGNVQKMIGTCHDITEIKYAEEKIRESELKFKGIFNQTFQFMSFLDAHGMVLEANESFAQFAGFREKDIVDQPFWEGPWWISEYERNQLQKAVQDAINGNFVRYEVQFVDKNGKQVPIDLSIKPIMDVDGEVIYLIAEGREITQLKKAQRKIEKLNRSLEEKVRQRTASLHETNLELQSFNYSVSHDLRAPIRAIRSFGELLQRRATKELSEESITLLNEIIDNARQMGVLIDDLLTFSKLGRIDLMRQPLYLEEVVQHEYDKLVLFENERDIDLTIHGCPSINADETMMHQIVQNLLSNSIKYTAHQKEALIEFGGEERENDLLFYIKDNGIGFKPTYKERIFGVFKRLHTTDYEGTGVGLAIVKRVIDRHGGEVWADAKPNAGTTVYFTLPKFTDHD